MKFIDLFAGLGGFHLALSKQGHKCVYACEIGDSLRKFYKKNFNILPDGDVTKIDIKKIPKHQILCAGFPCQPFSKAGSNQGFDHKIAGKMFFYLLKIIKIHKPEFLLLENVPNLLSHEKGKTWSFMKNKIISLGYDVDQKIISPIDFNIPQTRDRLYIVARKNKLNGFVWPEKLKEKNNLAQYLISKPKKIRKLTELKENVLKTWKLFLNNIPKKNYLPNPLWSMEFGATYPYIEETPYHSNIKKLRNSKGKFGVSLQNMNKIEIFKNLPNYSQVKIKVFPRWKILMIGKSRKFYEENKAWVNKFLPKLVALEKESHQKLEWNCQGDKMNLNKKIISFRGSGVRIRRNFSSPTLVSFTTTQVPYLPWKKRYMSFEECLNIQGFNKLKHHSFAFDKFYPAIGNAVNVGVISRIAKNLLST